MGRFLCFSETAPRSAAMNLFEGLGDLAGYCGVYVCVSFGGITDCGRFNTAAISFEANSGDSSSVRFELS